MRMTPFFIALLFFSCSNEVDRKYSTQQNNDEGNENAVSILFIGNSLTIANGGIDFHVQNFYNAGNFEVAVETHSVSISGASLKDHLVTNSTIGALNNKIWDYIILQENGIVATANPEETIKSILAFKEIIRPSTHVFLFMTWAYEGKPEMTEQLSQVYYEASELTNYKVIPVGLGWRDFENENITINLLESDGIHPNKFGTYFASTMIFNIISNQSIGQAPYYADLTLEEANFIINSVINSISKYY